MNWSFYSGKLLQKSTVCSQKSAVQNASKTRKTARDRKPKMVYWQDKPHGIRLFSKWRPISQEQKEVWKKPLYLLALAMLRSRTVTQLSCFSFASFCFLASLKPGAPISNLKSWTWPKLSGRQWSDSPRVPWSDSVGEADEIPSSLLLLFSLKK